MPRRRICIVSFLLLALFALVGFVFATEPAPADQVQVTTPVLRSIEPPPQSATADMLEERADALRAEKLYLDSLDYYRAALAKKPHTATIYNKIGIVELLMQRWPEAKKDFENAIRSDRQFSDAYNNLGVIFYITKKYGKAIDRYNKAINLKQDMASYYSNLGAALFSKKEFEKSAAAYGHALALDPDVFERTSKNGVAAQMSKPEDRAHYDYVVAKIYAKMGAPERSLEYLRRAMEEGYKGINSVYKDAEFAGVRKDPRFNELMAARPPAITD
jgi:tetratricopeptide (TPR) repeat protein